MTQTPAVAAAEAKTENKTRTETPVAAPQPQSATITLRAGNSTLTLLATRKADGSAVTTVTTKDTEKKTTERGMTAQHADMAAAKAHLGVLAEKAAKLGWARAKAVGAAPKPDAFSKLPAAPKGGS